MSTSEVRVPGPELDTVVREIVERICGDDWERRCTSGGEIVYYVVGFEAHRLDVSGAVTFDSEFPLRTQASPLTQWYTRAQVAAGHPDYVKDARARLVRLGIPDQSVGAFLSGQYQEVRTWHLGSDQLKAFNDLLEAMLIARRLTADEPDADNRHRFFNERGKAYLRDAAKKLAGLLSRVAKLEVLEFTDSQLEEASKCYLYGFHRAAVVCAAASLETHLKRRMGKKHFEKYSELADGAHWSGLLDGAQKEAADRVFKIRTEVVHHGLNPSPDQSATTLGLARGVIENIHS
jgi:hypothetical protein